MNIVFAGTPEFAATILKELLVEKFSIKAVYTQPDRPAGRGRKLAAGPVKQLAQQHILPVYQPATLKSPEAIAELKALAPDIMVVVAYGLILPEEALSVPRLGCINIHASLLPRWRGAAPIQRAILAGDRETGITIIQMNAGLDTGDMLARAPCAISGKETGGSLHDKLADLGAATVIQVLRQLATGEAPVGVAQDDAQATYAAKIDKRESWIDWTARAIDIERQVRAFNPWPATRSLYQGKPVHVFSAWADRVAITGDAAPGTIVDVSRDDGIAVVTGEGLLRLQRLQFPGGKPLDVAVILNSKSFSIGDCFENGPQGELKASGR